MTIERSPLQSAQNRHGIAKRRDPASNSTVGRDIQPSRHEVPSAVTDEGTQNLRSEVQPINAASPMVSIDDTGRNMTSSSAGQSPKDHFEMHRTEAGTEIDRS
jgi:hypothetical protein